MFLNTQTLSLEKLPSQNPVLELPLTDFSTRPPFQLRDYQQPHFEAGLALLKRHRCLLDASDTGTGKTFVALAICRALDAVPLVVGTKSGRGGWMAASQATGVEIEFVNYEKLRGRRTEGKNAESEWLEEMPWGKGSFLRFKHSLFMVVFDEVHRCSGATSLTSKTLIAAKRQHQYVLCLSATAADDPRQMKALGFAIDQHTLSKKIHGRRNWMGWLLSHGCTPGTFGGFDYTTVADKQKKVFVKLHHEVFTGPAARGVRMRKSEIPSFPQTTIDTLLLEPEDGKAAELAEELHSLSAKPCDLAERQRIRAKLELLKVPFLVDATKDSLLTSKVVVFVNFTETLHALHKSLSVVARVGLIWGGQTGPSGEAERQRNLSLFQQNSLDVLICNVQAGGESANMHDPTGQVERTVYISPPDSGRQLKQVFGRVNRDGGAKSLQLIVAFKGTYEDKMAERVMQKIDNLDMLNDAELKI
jgi:superfamily II DNA or RNA helicase